MRKNLNKNNVKIIFSNKKTPSVNNLLLLKIAMSHKKFPNRNSSAVLTNKNLKYLKYIIMWFYICFGFKEYKFINKF